MPPLAVTWTDRLCVQHDSPFTFELGIQIKLPRRPLKPHKTIYGLDEQVKFEDFLTKTKCKNCGIEISNELKYFVATLNPVPYYPGTFLILEF